MAAHKERQKLLSACLNMKYVDGISQNMESLIPY